MKNKKLFRIILCLTVSAMVTCGNVSVLATEDADTKLFYDGAPVVYVTDDSELPEAFRKNSEKMKDVPYTTPERQQAFNDFISNRFLRNKGISTYAVIRPSVDILQNPQDTNFYCGYASLQSVLEYHNIYKTQEEIADEAYYSDDALAWFAGSESQATNWRKYPAAVYLSDMLDLDYRPYSSYFGTFNASVLADKIEYDIDEKGEGILVCGISQGCDDCGSKLPGYPDCDIRHWIVVDGYYWDNTTQEMTEVTFVDPAKSDAISWSDGIKAYSHTELDRMFEFASGHGIIWCE